MLLQRRRDGESGREGVVRAEAGNGGHEGLLLLLLLLEL